MKKKPGFAAIFCSIFLFAAVPFAGEQKPGPENFTLKSMDGKETFTLSGAKGKYVALHFLLKTECPLCLLHTQVYANRQDEVPDVIHIFLKPDTDEEIQAWASNIEVEEGKKIPTIYRDPQAKLAKEFKIPDGYEFHGQTVHYPAFILLGPDGQEVLRYVGESNRDRLRFDDFKKIMVDLKKK